MSSMELPEDTHLAYYVTHEAWYARTLPDDRREINVAASAQGSGGGVAWEFTVEEVDLGSHGPAIRVKVFDDAFAAFTQIPGFFRELADGKVSTLAEVCRLLDDMLAVDETERRGPGGEAPVKATAERIRRAIAETLPDGSPAAAAATAVMRALGMESSPR